MVAFMKSLHNDPTFAKAACVFFNGYISYTNAVKCNQAIPLDFDTCNSQQPLWLKQIFDNLISHVNNCDTAKVIPNSKEDKTMPYLKEGKIRKRKDNRWEARIMKNGTTISAINVNQAKCIQIFEIKLKEYNSLTKNSKVKIEKLTLHSLIDKWYEMEILPNIRTGRKIEKGKIGESQDRSIRAAIKYHIKPHYPDKPLDKLTLLDLKESSPKAKSSRSREDADTVVGQILKWAYDNELMKKNLEPKFKRHKHERESGIAFTREEQGRILEYAKTHNRYYMAYMFYFWTGCRPGELLDVRHCDINVVARTIFIDGTKTKTSSRPMPLLKPLHQFADKIVPGSTEKVFQVSYKTLRNDFKKILTALGIAGESNIPDDDSDNKKHSLKSTRHSFITRMLEKGANDKAISKWVGHSTTITTNHYTHILDEFEQEQAIKINERLQSY